MKIRKTAEIAQWEKRLYQRTRGYKRYKKKTPRNSGFKFSRLRRGFSKFSFGGKHKFICDSFERLFDEDDK